MILVKEQFDPNPDFPTVKYPNPEEGPSSLKAAVSCANAHGAKYIFANDPDADRFLVAERKNETEFRIFTGNEIAALLGVFIGVN